MRFFDYQVKMKKPSLSVQGRLSFILSVQLTYESNSPAPYEKCLQHQHIAGAATIIIIQVIIFFIVLQQIESMPFCNKNKCSLAILGFF
jgi:hypothetical protein